MGAAGAVSQPYHMAHYQGNIPGHDQDLRGDSSLPTQRGGSAFYGRDGFTAGVNPDNRQAYQSSFGGGMGQSAMGGGMGQSSFGGGMGQSAMGGMGQSSFGGGMGQSAMGGGMGQSITGSLILIINRTCPIGNVVRGISEGSIGLANAALWAGLPSNA
jgi:hypothetical protein